MIRKVTKRLTAASTWAASSDLTPVDLPREGIITQIVVRANITATLTAAAYDDWFRRVIQNIKIQGDGGRTYLGMGGVQMSTMLSLQNEIVMGMPTLHSNGAGIALAAPDVGSTAFTAVFVFHPGNNPRDPFDMSSAIPAKWLSTLQVLLSTTLNTVCDTAGTISAGTFNYEISEVLFDASDVGNGIPAAMFTPLGSTFTYSHTATYSDFGYTIDVPTGAFLRSIWARFTDDTTTFGRRKDDEVTAIKLYTPKDGGNIIFEQNIYELKQAMMQRFACHGIAGDVGPVGAIATTRPSPASTMDMVPAGFVVIDLRPYGTAFGLDLRGYQNGDVKLGLTIGSYSAGDFSTFYWDQHTPITLK